MKKCRKCKNDLQKDARRCHHCGAKVLPIWAKACSVVIGGIILFFLVTSLIGGNSPDKKSTQTGHAIINEQLELESFRLYQSYGFVYLEGRVKNISPKKLENLQAVGEFTDANGAFIKSDIGFLEYDPLLPGQAAPFKIMGTGNPAIKKGTVTFKTLFGGTIPTKYPKK